ncbi:MAG: YcbK family protein [Desulfuromonadales bacterium]
MQDKCLDAPSTPVITRRQILKVGLFASVACLSPLPAWARFNLTGLNERSLSLLNTHTGERLKEVVYWEKGLYLPDALHDINYVLRDHRTDEIHKIDPKTLDLMAAISRKLDAKRPFEIISGYRSPQTNQYLRSLSNGVAKNSYHIQGKAVDLRLPGVPLKHVRKAAIDLRMGGVGYYPQSDFVHVDSGKVRYW